MTDHIQRHSPSSLGLFCTDIALFLVERVLGRKQGVGVAAYRGTAVEAGVAHGLLNRDSDPAECIEVAKRSYRKLSALSSDPKREKYDTTIDEMVLRGLTELRPYGVPSATQRWIEWRPEGLKYPIVGMLDFEWNDHGIVLDFKTTQSLPSRVKESHARQCAFYCEGNKGGRIAYVTPSKSAVYGIENIQEHRKGLYRIALACERFLALSNDPQELIALVAPDLDHYFWDGALARQTAFEVFEF